MTFAIEMVPREHDVYRSFHHHVIQAAPREREFDRETLLPVRFVPSDNTWSRVDYAVKIMIATGDKDYLQTLQRLAAEHPAHFVRWSAISGVVNLDFDAGLNLLEQAAKDEHPHVRNAAEKTIQSFLAATVVAG